MKFVKFEWAHVAATEIASSNPTGSTFLSHTLQQIVQVPQAV